MALRERAENVIQLRAQREGAVLNGKSMESPIALEQPNVPDELLAKELALYYSDPLGFGMAAYRVPS